MLHCMMFTSGNSSKIMCIKITGNNCQRFLNVSVESTEHTH
uniref:Uncharacterized protein n=1 Tax=Anguilla anguilla TaxID=7936 RepID=A0A0E9P971_ANGAN